MNINCVKTSKIKNSEVLAKIAYNNFKYLSEYPELQHNIKEIKKALESKGNITYLLYHKNKFVGYLIGDIRTFFDGRYGYYISYFYIMEKYRGANIGSKLMDILMDDCKKNNCNLIILTCDSRDMKVIKFYKKYGFDIDKNLDQNKIHKVYSLLLV